MPAIIHVQHGPLDLNAMMAGPQNVESGAVLTFVGVVRNQNLGKPVVALDYDCAPDLARAALHSIAAEACMRWEIRALTLCHAYGRIAIGQPSVLIAVGTPKRAAAYEASRWLIETVKQRVPIWKCEVYADGQATWLDGTPLPEAMAKPARAAA
jgi:molybdopterin synthase catalytic subunit